MGIHSRLRREGLIKYVERFSFPVVVISSDYSIVLMNRSASERFARSEGKCYEVTHNIDRPCWEVLGKDSCPIKTIQERGNTYAFHEHEISEEAHVVAAGRLDEDLYIEFYLNSYITDMIEEFRFLAEMDPITGVYNAGKMKEILKAEIERSVRYDQPLSLIVLELNCGPQENEEVLRSVAGMVKRSVRKTDWVGRSGGEEFLVLLPQTDIDRAIWVGERIKASVEETQKGTTVSVGITSLRPGDTSDRILERASRATRLAKDKGSGIEVL